MNENTFEYFAKKYPLLFQKSTFETFDGIGPGWFNILDVLFNSIYFDVGMIESSLARYRQLNNNRYWSEEIEKLEIELNKRVEELPSINTIKEKFGGLRIYYTGGLDIHGSYFDFAESISSKTCYICGAPGSLSKDSFYIQALCSQHLEERQDMNKEFSRIHLAEFHYENFEQDDGNQEN